MSFFDLFWSADWGGLYRAFAKGSPPLLVQLLALNTIVFTLYVVRGMTSKHRMRSTTREIVQALLILVNFVVIFQDQTLGWMAPYLSRLGNLI